MSYWYDEMIKYLAVGLSFEGLQLVLSKTLGNEHKLDYSLTVWNYRMYITEIRNASLNLM